MKTMIKRGFPLLIILALIFGTFPAVVANAEDTYETLSESLSENVDVTGLSEPELQGDIDKDGRVTVSDIVLMRSIIMGGPPTAEELAIGDLDKDGKISVSDIVYLRKKIMTIEIEQYFVLTISVEEDTLPHGEKFTVNVELKNNSQHDYEIFYSFLFWPDIPGWRWRPFGDIEVDPPYPQTRLFEANSVLQNIWLSGSEGGPYLIGSDLEPGTHELKFRASFYLNWQQENEQEIVIWSNTLMLTVQ